MTGIASLSLIHLLCLFIWHVNLKYLNCSDPFTPFVTSWIRWVFVSTVFFCWHTRPCSEIYAINCSDCLSVQNGEQEFVILNKVLLFLNFQGVKILDMISKQRITNVPRDDISLRPDMYPCSLCWKDNLTLIIGWGNSVKVQLPVFVINACCYHRQTEDCF